jgi:hypothetical protein
LIRPAADFGVEKRAGKELHAGPAALALADGGRTVIALSRFHGGLTEIDAADPRALRVKAQRPGPPMRAQHQRRQGEVLYFTDLGRSSISCDACHPDGHDDGVFFEKTHPQRIYRASSLRSARETPPYFFPGAFPTLEMTSEIVLGRNRLGNAAPTADEISALTAFQKGMVALPNPYRGARGELPTHITLPDGHAGDPRRGLMLFEGKAGCATAACHPPPHYTSDQDAKTRGTPQDAGTPVALPLRPHLQEAPPGPRAVPSLIGAWDEFPLLASGAAGLEVAADGTVEPRHPFALRRALELHGVQLGAQEMNDVLAFLLTL